ncbi:MAG: sulfurtransferase [Bacteroidetes bacterium MedPE-SWsnd-G2]|nr:MAG: sulfurtransferase [Bacteroidetes bacterium MedPE-SWsnd-G2]
MGLFDFLKGNKSKLIEDFKQRGALVLDVRTVSEYNSGHIKNSKNIPLQNINGSIEKIKGFNAPIITCCASGMRSSNAASILKRQGIEVVNGGGWQSLSKKLKP